MKVSPLDLRQQRFRKSFRGFDPVEVASFMAAVADDYEQALRETDRLRQDLMRMEVVLAEHREHEKNLQEHAAHGAETRGRDQGERRAGSAAHHPRGRGPSELLLQRDTVPPRGHPAGNRRHELKRKDVEASIEANIIDASATRWNSFANRKRASATTRSYLRPRPPTAARQAPAARRQHARRRPLAERVGLVRRARRHHVEVRVIRARPRPRRR